ncbi:hypothetical protein [Dactylosporangium sp. CA-139066]|uniref:hypothetical protein n=1 Tax=Dactylosporangium sp. CA-139066 TaxID=3239930 RepID=UPI003D8BE02C
MNDKPQPEVRTTVRPVRSGGLATNHSQAAEIRTTVRSGGLTTNHSQAAPRRDRAAEPR